MLDAQKLELYAKKFKGFSSSLRLCEKSTNCFIHQCRIVDHFANGVEGMDYFVWYAVDREGYVGIFESRIPSPVPCEFFEISRDEYTILLDYFEIDDYYSSTGEITNLPAVDKRVREAKKERGWFFYCSHEDDEYYFRCCVPNVAKHYTALPGDVGEIVCKMQFPGVFSSAKIIDVKGCWDKWHGETPSDRFFNKKS